MTKEKTVEIERPNSVEISINAKGQHSGKLKVYADTIHGALVLAQDKAGDLKAFLDRKNKGVE